MKIIHKQIRIKHDNFDEANVDIEIAPIVLECWRSEIYTKRSCQDFNSTGYIWIEFLTADDAQKFLTIVAGQYSSESDSLYNRLVKGWKGGKKLDCWHYEASVDDWSVTTNIVDEQFFEETQIKKTDVMISVSVRFPSRDKEQVFNSLYYYNASCCVDANRVGIDQAA